MRTTYPNPMRLWEERSWIRSKPTREGDIAGLPFRADLVPLARHAAITAIPGAAEKVLAFRLLAHLKFTTILEIKHVNEVCSQMVEGKSPVELSSDVRRDALKIYCDEGGHALFVELLAKDAEKTFGVDSQILGRPSFDTAMERLAAENPKNARLLHHLFVAISETLVSKILRDIPNDPGVASVVREVISDHAADEATHSAFFRWYFPRLWQSLGERERSELGVLLPELVWIFLSPDLTTDTTVLQSLGFSLSDAERMVAEVNPVQEVAATVREAARPTLEMFRQAGVMEIPEVREAFWRKELLCVN